MFDRLTCTPLLYVTYADAEIEANRIYVVVLTEGVGTEQALGFRF